MHNGLRLCVFFWINRMNTTWCQKSNSIIANRYCAIRMAMSTGSDIIHGRQSPPFEVSTMSQAVSKWKIWKRQWQAYSSDAQLSKKDESYRLDIFVSCIRAYGVEVMDRLPFKSESDRGKPKEILCLLDDRFLGEENTVQERFEFYSRAQGQMIDSFISDLRLLARTCKIV